MDASRVNLRRYYIVICLKMTCCAVPLGLALGEACFWGVGCGRAIGICVSGCGIEALFSSQLKWRFWWMGVCCGANFVEAHVR